MREISTGLDEDFESRACLPGNCEASAQKTDLCFSWSRDVNLAAWRNRGKNLLGGKTSSVKDWANGLKNCNPVAWLYDIALRIKESAVDYPASWHF